MGISIYSNDVVLITGGAGAIGSRLVQALLDRDVKKVIVLDNLSSGYTWNIVNSKKVLFVKGDIANDIDLRRVYNEKPNIIFHLAAFFANQNSVDYPQLDLQTNGSGTLKLLEYALLNKENIDRFVYASSGCSLYPSDGEMPYKEHLITTYLSTPYQITKMLGELYCNYFWKVHELPTCKARFFNSYGPGEVPGQYRNVIPNFLYWAKMGLKLPITGSGEETRDFTFVDDIVDGLLEMGKREGVVGEEINLAAGREIKIIDLAKKINEMTHNPSGIEYKSRRNWDTKSRMLADNSKAKSILDFKSTHTFEEGLLITLKWMEDNWDRIEESVDFPPGMSSAVKE